MKVNVIRFVTPDTVIDEELSTQGWNRYAYCKGNPIRYNDPTGHDWRDKVLSGAQSIGEGIRNVGERITQPLRDAGEWLKEKLNGSLQNKANGTGNRLNGAARYVNQLKEINPNGTSSCGPATVSMITGEDPNKVAKALGNSTCDEKLIKYLKDKGYQTNKIVDGGSEKTRWSFKPSDKDFGKMRSELDKGKTILYHFAGDDGKSNGHYALLKGYDKNTNEYIFNDPAGDRKLNYFNDKGEDVRYTIDQMKEAGIKRLFSVSRKEDK